MADLEITINVTGLDEMQRQIDPKQVYTIITTWFDRASKYLKSELRSNSPTRLQSKVYIRMDTVRPPRWARIGIKSPLTWIIEGGTGSLGNSEFKHVSRHWPSVQGIMDDAGLSRQEAFLMARTVGLRGGNPPRPFIQPTYLATKGTVEQMANDIAKEVMRT